MKPSHNWDEISDKLFECLENSEGFGPKFQNFKQYVILSERDGKSGDKVIEQLNAFIESTESQVKGEKKEDFSRLMASVLEHNPRRDQIYALDKPDPFVLALKNFFNKKGEKGEADFNEVKASVMSSKIIADQDKEKVCKHMNGILRDAVGPKGYSFKRSIKQFISDAFGHLFSKDRKTTKDIISETLNSQKADFLSVALSKDKTGASRQI